MPARILVPLGTSLHAIGALPVAMKIARLTEAELLLLTVDPHSALFDRVTTFDGRALHDVLDQYLTRVCAALRREALAARHFVLHGNPAERIVQAAQEHDAELIVMSSHGRNTMERWSLGSVSDAVMRNAPVPVLLWHPPDPIDPMAAFHPQRILVPLDGSPGSEAIVPHALWLASITQARITLLQVRPHAAVSDVLSQDADTPDDPAFLMATDAQAELASAAYLTSVVQRYRLTDASTITAFSDRHVHRAIIDFANQAHIDVIAMATHGRSGFTRLVLGSVTAHVLAQLRMPVLTLSLNPDAPRVTTDGYPNHFFARSTSADAAAQHAERRNA